MNNLQIRHHCLLVCECENAQRADERAIARNRCEEGTEEATGPELRTCIDLPQAGRRDVSLEEIKLQDITEGKGRTSLKSVLLGFMSSSCFANFFNRYLSPSLV